MNTKTEQNNQIIIAPKDAREWVKSLLRNMYLLRKATWDSGLGDKWLDRQFVITKGNLLDLLRMFDEMAKVEERKGALTNGKNETD